jgi:GTPase SAR1 family protein
MNIILIGDSITGKTSFIHRLIDNTFHESYLSTIGKDLHIYEHKNQKLFLHDCSGMDRYYSMIQLYFKIADGALIFYNDKNTNIDKWKGLLPDSTPFLLVKNGGEKDKIQDIHIDCELDINIEKVIELIVSKIPKKTMEQKTLMNLVYEYIMSFFPIFN